MPVTPKEPIMAVVPTLTGYDHFVQNLKYNDLVRDDAEAYLNSFDFWNRLTPWQKTQWDNHAIDFMERYTRDTQYVVTSMADKDPQYLATLMDKEPNLARTSTGISSGTNQGIAVQGIAVQGAMAQGAMAQGAMAQGAMAQGAMVQGAMAQGAMAQGAMAQGAMAQGAVAQGATAQGATAQGAAAQGATAQGATAQGAAAKGATAQGAAAQGAAAKGAVAQGTTAPGATCQGVMAQGATVQGVMAQGAMNPTVQGGYRGQRTAYVNLTQRPTVQGYWGQRATTRYVETYDKMDGGISFKAYLYYGNVPKPEVRRFRIGHMESSKFASLQSMIRDVYQLKSSKFSIAWKDEEGDEVVISSDAEVITMLSDKQDGVLKVIVRCENDIKAQNPKPEAKQAHTVSFHAKTGVLVGGVHPLLHKGVTCGGCGGDVIGYRYKCIACKNYDLCRMCEAAGMHSEHCFIRINQPSLLTPVIKTTLKGSRRVLKGLAVASLDENKKRYRFEMKQTAKPNTQGKQDSKTGASADLAETLAKYKDDFAKITGNLACFLENATGTSEAATSTEPRSGETNISVPISDLGQHHPDESHPDYLQAIKDTLKYVNKYRYAAKNEMGLMKGVSNLTRDEKDEAGPSPRQEAINLCAGNPKLAPTQAALSDSAKMAKTTTTKQGTPASARKYITITDLANAVNTKCDAIAKARLCSEGNGYEKAEGWTVIDAEILKDENADVAAADVEDGPMNEEEPIRQQALPYPKLNANSAVFNPRESVVAEAGTSASAGPALAAPAPVPAPTVLAPAGPTKPTAEEAKKATSADSEILDLRTQIAPNVEAALKQMEMMGFSNESGWLTQLLAHHDGNIAVVLDLLAPVKGANASNAPNADRK